MNEQDQLSKLLQNWKSDSPIKAEKFTADTMRAIRQNQTVSFGQSLVLLLERMIDTWLPSPNVFVPAAMVIILGITGLHWKVATDKGMTFASLRWQESVSLPFSEKHE